MGIDMDSKAARPVETLATVWASMTFSILGRIIVVIFPASLWRTVNG